MNAPHLAGLALALAALVACGGDDECSIAAIQADIMKYGPATAAFTVYFLCLCLHAKPKWTLEVQKAR